MPGANCFPHTITVQSKAATNTDGRQVPTYSNAYANLAAFVQPASSSRKDWYESRNIEITHEIYVGQALTVTVGYIVQFGTRQFYITGFRNLLESNKVFILDCREVTGTEIIIQA